MMYKGFAWEPLLNNQQRLKAWFMGGFICLLAVLSLTRDYRFPIWPPTTAPQTVAPAASLLNNATEMQEMRDPYSRHFALPSGEFVAEVSLEPRFYETAAGEWLPIDPTFAPTAQGWTVSENSLQSTIAAAEPAVTLNRDGYQLTWEPQTVSVLDDTGARTILSERAEAYWDGEKLSATEIGYEGQWTAAGLEDRLHSGIGQLDYQLQVPPDAFATSPAAEWVELTLAADLPDGVLFYTNGRAQQLPFTTNSPVDIETPFGDLLLTLEPPTAYEVNFPEQQTFGQMTFRQAADGGVLLGMQIPAGWWFAAERSGPLAIDPTMHVIQVVEAKSFLALTDPFDDTDDDDIDMAKAQPTDQNPASIGNRICAGNTKHSASGSLSRMGIYSSFFRYPLPSLPEGLQPTEALLVGIPEPHQFPAYGLDKLSVQPTHLGRVTGDWTTFVMTDTQTSGWNADFSALVTTLETQDVYQPHPSLVDPNNPTYPATVWDVTSTVQDWYNNPASNYGFAIYPQYYGFYLWEDILPTGRPMSRACYPLSAKWEPQDAPDPTADIPSAAAPGMIMLITYASPNLANDSFRTDVVPSAQPDGSYAYQYHEYDMPAIGNHWQLVGVQGASTVDNWRAKVPLNLVHESLEQPIISDLGNATTGNESYQWQPNYMVVNGHQSPPADLKLRVKADTSPTGDHNSKLYYMETQTAAPSPVWPPLGNTTTVTMTLFRSLISGQELNLAADTTVEIRIPYATAGLSPADAHRYNWQLFSSGDTYGSRQQNGAFLTAGPDAYEIELSISAAQAGNWLLVLNSNIGRSIIDMYPEITACANTDQVVRYPLDGECVELRRPTSTQLQNSTLTKVFGDFRIFNPAGFTGDCNSSCTTNDKDNGTPIMPLIGRVGEDDRWVALKGGTFTITGGSSITTSPDSRLVLADFSDPNIITSLPVLRGDFQAQDSADSETLIPTSTPYLLVNHPFHPGESQPAGWDYLIDFDHVRLVSNGTFAPDIEPTAGEGATTFTYDASWSIDMYGGSSLDGVVDLQSASSGVVKLGSLNITPPADSYALEYNPQNGSPYNPAKIPDFTYVRMTGATLFQEDNMGGARIAVQGVFFVIPGTSIKDAEFNEVAVQCGTYCFDLRGETDAMSQNGPLVDREYRMPDVVIQDSANTIMLNLPSGAEIYSADHPMSRAIGMDDLNFNYGAFNASVRTFEGPCPGPRDPLDPDKQGPDGPITTVVVGKAGMSLPNVDSDSADPNGGPEISVGFVLCSGSLRELSFTFSTGQQTGIPVGTSGMFMHLIGGTISLTPQQPGQTSYTTVVLEVAFRGMAAPASASNVFIKGIVTIDSRGLFDVQLQAGLRVVADIGLAVDGHFWVAWSPLDLGFEVEACIPYDGTYNQIDFPPTLCQGNELLFGMLKMHLWQGQGWQNKYDWLPDNDDLHTAARFEAQLTIPKGAIIDWGPAQVPPGDFPLVGIKLAFGEFCMNQSCTQYEWGVMGALSILGYDVGMYYGFDSGLSFIMGSADYVLIDEVGQARGSQPIQLQQTRAVGADTKTTTVEVPPHASSAIFGIGRYENGNIALSLIEPAPGNRTIDLKSTMEPDVTINISSDTVGDNVSIAIEDPLPGTWRVEMTVDDINPDTPAEYRFYYMANQKPELDFSPLPGSTTDEPTIPIEWDMTTTMTDTLWLSLYYETQTRTWTESVEVVGPIVEHLPLSAGNKYDWNIEGLPTGEYQVFYRLENAAAMVVNGCGEGYEYSNNPTTAGCNTMLASGLPMVGEAIYLPDLITIIDTIPPAAPQISNGYPEDETSVVVRWEPNSEADLAGYRVTCTQPQLSRTVRVSASIEGNSTLKESVRVVGLDAGVPAACSVVAYDNSFNISSASANVNVTPTGNVPASPVQVLELVAPTLNPNDVQISWSNVINANGYYVLITKLLGDDNRARSRSAALFDGRATALNSPIDVGDVNSYLLTGLEAGATYEIQVKAYDADGRVGEGSAVLTVTTPTSQSLYLPVIMQKP